MPNSGSTASAAQNVAHLQRRLRELEAEQAELRAALERAGVPYGPADPAAVAARANPVAMLYRQIAEILDISADAIISVDDRGMIRRFNRGAEEIFGYRSSEIIGRPLDILIPERFRHGHRAHMTRFGQAAESSRLMNERGEIFGLRREGTEFPAEASIARLTGPGGRPTYTVTLRDITERADAELALRERESQLHQAHKMARIGTFVWDETTNSCAYCSEELASMLGTTVPQFMALSRSMDGMLEQVHPDDREQYAEVIRRADEEISAYDVEYRLRFDDGNERNIREMGEPETDSAGNLVRTFGTLQDITHIRKAEEALRRSEAQLRQAHRLAKIGTFLWDDLEDRCLYCSDEMAALFGMAPSDFIAQRGTGETFLAFIVPEDRERFCSVIEQAARERRPYDIEYRCKDAEGNILHLREVAELEFDVNGSLIRTFGTAQDITAMRRTEEALRHSEQQLRTIADNLPAFIGYTDKDSYMQFANRTVAEWYADDPRNLVGRHASDIVGDEAYERLVPNFARVLSGESTRYEEYRDFPDGKSRYVDITNIPDFDEQGEVQGWFSLIQDITERKISEEALRSSERQLRAITDNLPAAISYVDRRQRFRFINRVGEEWYGRAAEDIVGAPLVDIFDSEYYAFIQPHIAHVLRGKSSRFETRVTFPDGRDRHIEAAYLPSFAEGGEVLGWFALVQDVTDRKQAEESLRESERQFRDLIEGSIQGVVIHRDFETLFMNDAWAAIFGYESVEDACQEDSVLAFVAPGDRERLIAFKEARKRGAAEVPDRYEFEGLRKDGSHIWVEILARSVTWKGQSAILSTAVDITERKSAEQALRRSEEKLRTVTDNVPALISYIDSGERYRLVNRVCEEWNAVPAEEMLNMTLKEVVGAAAYDILGPAVKTVKQGKLAQFELTRDFNDGVQRIVDVNFVPDLDEDGKVLGWYSLLYDMTESRIAERALRDSEQQLRTVTGNIPAFVTYQDRDLRFRFVNKTAAQWYGQPAEQLLGRSASEFLDPETRVILKSKIDRVFAGERVRFEINRTFPDGEERSVDISYAPHFDENGDVQGFFTLILDITERRQAEEALRRTMQSGELLRQVATAANEAANAEEAMAKCLKAFCRFGDWEIGNVYVTVDDESGNLAPAGLWWSEEEAKFAELIRVTENTVFAPGEGLPGRVAESGEPAWISDIAKDTNFPRRMDVADIGVTSGFAFPVMVGRKVAAVLEFFSPSPRSPDRNMFDISAQAGTILGRVIERQRAARELAEREQQISLITENLPVLITYVGPDWRFRFVNKTTERWYGYPAEQLVGRKLEEFLEPEIFEKFRPHIKAALAGELVQFEETVRYREGGERNIEGTYIPHFDVTGVERGFFALVADVTERVRAEKERRQSQKLEAVGQLTGGVAHDFNNLLAVILGNAELLRDSPGDPEDAVDSITRAARRGSELTQRLLSFSRLQPLRPEILELPELAKDMARVLTRTLGAKIQIKTRFGRNVAPARADRGQLESAILNLAVNAQQAMPDGGTLGLEIRNVRVTKAEASRQDGVAAGNYVLVAASDTGVGMSDEVAAQAFEPFFTTKGVGEGSGLGLSMVYGFASQSGGFATIDSKPGKGATVSIYLPRAAGVKKAAPAEPPARKSDQPGGAIMVVEDDPDVRRLTVTLLSSLGYKVLQAEDGESALTILESGEAIDLLLSDVVLPGDLSGPAIAEQAHRLRPDLRVLFMSGYAEDVIERDRNGGDQSIDADLLAKPFTRNQLAAKVKASLETASAHKG